MIHAWWYISNNFGDNLNHYLIKALSNQPVIYTERDRPHHIVCGSILHECNEHSTVWGAGFGNKDQCLNTDKANIIGVRGELSHKMLGIDCVVGDPALLLPKVYNPLVQKKHDLGIIPHYGHYEEILKTQSPAHIIDPFLPTEQFINEVLSCNVIYSSSLHGLIVADAYGIPNKWVIYGDTFKYRDYYSTTINPKEPFNMSDLSKPFVSEYKYPLDDLLNSCPFYGR